MSLHSTVLGCSRGPCEAEKGGPATQPQPAALHSVQGWGSRCRTEKSLSLFLFLSLPWVSRPGWVLRLPPAGSQASHSVGSGSQVRGLCLSWYHSLQRTEGLPEPPLLSQQFSFYFWAHYHFSLVVTHPLIFLFILLELLLEHLCCSRGSFWSLLLHGSNNCSHHFSSFLSPLWA